MGLKERFYSRLEQDLALRGSRSFLAVYLRDNKPPGGAYQELTALWEQVTAGARPLGDYVDQARQVLSSGRRLGISRTARTLLSASPSAPEQLERVHRELTDSLLVKAAQEYIYNARRKKDSALNLLDAWMSASGEGSAPTALQTDEIEDWRSLHALLCRRAEESELGREQAANVFLPVWTDPRSGAGVYLTGQDYFWALSCKGKSLDQVIGCPCWFTLFLFGDFVSPDAGEDSLTLRWDLDLTDHFPDAHGISFAETLTRHLCFTDPAKAMAALEELGSRVYSGYQFPNGAPPPGCPPALLRYFEPGGEDDFEDLAELGRAAFAADKPAKPSS